MKHHPKELRIVFMGTPEFAVESLKALVENQYNVVGVVTMPDKPAGRGYKLQMSAVKEYALAQDIPLLQPEKLKDEAFLDALKAWRADLQIVVAFRMLPQVVWDMPPMGTFNLHASLLPQFRGAAPINWAIINGEKKTGITTFFLTHEIDTGAIIQQRETDILPEDNVGTLYERLMKMGGELVCETVDLIAQEKVELMQQESVITSGTVLLPAPKLTKENTRIDWTKTAQEVVNLIRGLNPYPAAWTILQQCNKDITSIKIYEATAAREDHELPHGTILSDGKRTIRVAVKDGYVQIESLQLAGKRRMSSQELLCGTKFSSCDRMN